MRTRMMTVRSLWLVAAGALAACGQADGQGNGPGPQASVTNSPAAAPAAATAAPARASRFTKLDDTACGAEKVIEETGDWDRRCEGVAGYALEWGSGDLRED